MIKNLISDIKRKNDAVKVIKTTSQHQVVVERKKYYSDPTCISTSLIIFDYDLRFNSYIRTANIDLGVNVFVAEEEDLIAITSSNYVILYDTYDGDLYIKRNHDYITSCTIHPSYDHIQLDCRGSMNAIYWGDGPRVIWKYLFKRHKIDFINRETKRA